MISNPLCPTFHKDKNLQIYLNFSNSLQLEGYNKKYFQNVVMVFGSVFVYTAISEISKLLCL